MLLKNRSELLLIFLLFIFSWWLMNKSLQYDASTHTFLIARHQVGDFGLHLSLIRSFSWGDNIPAESPLFPGKPLPYHYFFDFIAGMLAKTGLRIDIAFNILGALSLTWLMVLIYKFPQLLFEKKPIIGIISLILFIFHSNFVFFDFIKGKKITEIIPSIWYIPDYLYKGPFDGSVVSIFFTWNVFLNQRHFILALAISFTILYIVLYYLVKSKKIPISVLLLSGIVIGIVLKFHTLTSISMVIVICLLFFSYKQYKNLVIFAIPALLLIVFYSKDIISQDFSHPFFVPGFLTAGSLSLWSFLEFWILNLGISFFLVPVAFLVSNRKQKMFFLCIFSLFIIGNLFQLSFRIEHNHSLFNIFIIISNFYIAYLLVYLWKKQKVWKVLSIIFFFLLTVSGVLDLLVVKNDFHFPYSDYPTNQKMVWIKEKTNKSAIFLSKQEILDPITLAGRKNYLGYIYYMGYNTQKREEEVRRYFSVNDKDTIQEMKLKGIDYIAIPKIKSPDFPYDVNVNFLTKNLSLVYQDKEILIFKL